MPPTKPTLPNTPIIITANDRPAGVIWRGWWGRVEKVMALAKKLFSKERVKR